MDSCVVEMPRVDGDTQVKHVIALSKALRCSIAQVQGVSRLLNLVIFFFSDVCIQ